MCRAWVDDRPARRVSRGRKGQRHRIQPRLRAPVLQAVVRRASCRFRPRIARRTMVAIWDRSPHSARNVITKACEKMGRSVDLAAIPAAAGGGYTGGKAPRRYKKGRRLEIDAAGDGTTGVEHNICMYRGRGGGYIPASRSSSFALSSACTCTTSTPGQTGKAPEAACERSMTVLGRGSSATA